MQLRKPRQPMRCSAIIQPGEFTIDVWDGKQCSESGYYLSRCEYCGQLFCLIYHYHDHLDKERERDNETM